MSILPPSEMFGYATSLRSNTQGRGNFTMVFDHYEEVPKNIAEEIIKSCKVARTLIIGYPARTPF